MKSYPILTALLATLLLTSCEKEINIDYHTTSKLHVIEASMTPTGTRARVSRTNDMDDNSYVSDLTDAKLTITGEDGSSWTLTHQRNGNYQSAKTGTPGVTYRLDAEVEGQHYSSTSTMQRQPTINSFRLIRKKIASQWIQMGDVRIQDIANETNWYFIHLYRNNVGYRWAVMRDDSDPNHELQSLMSFFREGSNDSDVLNEGDLLRLEVRAIDERSYDYLYSMQVMESTGTNPVQNFTGGCLGYFSAFGITELTREYHSADVEDEE